MRFTRRAVAWLKRARLHGEPTVQRRGDRVNPGANNHGIETRREKSRWSAGPVASLVTTLSGGSSGKAFGSAGPISNSHVSARQTPMTS